MFPEFILYVRHYSECIERYDLLLFLTILFLEKDKDISAATIYARLQYFSTLWDNYLEQSERAQIK